MKIVGHNDGSVNQKFHIKLHPCTNDFYKVVPGKYISGSPLIYGCKYLDFSRSNLEMDLFLPLYNSLAINNTDFCSVHL